MKYVMFMIKHGTIERKVPIIFPNMLVHQEVAQATMPMLTKTFPTASIEIINAGECSSLDLAHAVGRSESLNLKAHEGDGLVLSTYDYTFGVM